MLVLSRGRVAAIRSVEHVGPGEVYEARIAFPPIYFGSGSHRVFAVPGRVESCQVLGSEVVRVVCPD